MIFEPNDRWYYHMLVGVFKKADIVPQLRETFRPQSPQPPASFRLFGHPIGSAPVQSAFSSAANTSKRSATRP